MARIKLSERLPKDLTPSPFFEELEKAKKDIIANAGKNIAENLRSERGSEGDNVDAGKIIAPFIDMTVSSPVRVGLPVELDAAVDTARSQFGQWYPDASGWRSAREAVAKYYKDRGGVFTENQIIVTASTSEAYSVLFKTFCNPGDAILTPMPGYPLLDTLAQLEHLECAPYFLKLVREKARGSRPEVRGLRSAKSLREQLAARNSARSCPLEPCDNSPTCCPPDGAGISLQFSPSDDVSNSPQASASDGVCGVPTSCHPERSAVEACPELVSGKDPSNPSASSKPQSSFRFVIDTDSLLTAPENARILLLVSPHNPTGHIVSLSEWNEIVHFCEDNSLILVVDEVFGDYGFSDEVKRSWQYIRRENGPEALQTRDERETELEARGIRPEALGAHCPPAVASNSPTLNSPDTAGNSLTLNSPSVDFFDCGGNDFVFAPVDGPKCPIFWLNGLSKAVGAPQLKFGWMAFYAPREQFEEIRAALEFVEDAYLSASSCAQSLAAPLLAKSADYESMVSARLKQNWETLQAAFPSKYCPKVLGGWYAVVHLGDDDEELTLRLLREKHVLVQPGFFFDFEEDGWVVISLLQEPALFAEAVKRMAELLT